MNDPRSLRIGPFGEYAVFSGLGMLVSVLVLGLINGYVGASNPGMTAAIIIGVLIITIIGDKLIFSRISRNIRLLAGGLGWLATFFLIFRWMMSS